MNTTQEHTMSDTKTIRTPAADALAEYEPIAEATRNLLKQETEQALKYQSADDVIAQARALNPYFASKIRTKKVAVATLVRDAWTQSETYQFLKTLTKAADNEERIIEAATSTKRGEVFVKEQIAEALATTGYVRYEQVLDLVASARIAQVRDGLWDTVRDWMTDPDNPRSPIEALEAVREQAVRSLTGTHANRAQSRSTSVTRNFDQDLEREALAEWLDNLWRVVSR